MSTDIPPRFRKTKSDKWAVMAPVPTLEKALAAGGTVQVLKRSGDWSEFHIASLGKPFDVDGVEMCYGYGPDEEDSSGGEARPGDAARAGGAPRRAPAAQQPYRPPATSAEPPPYDASEPLPEYQGEAEDTYYDEAF